MSPSLFKDLSKEAKSVAQNGKTKDQSESRVDKRDSNMDAGTESLSGTEDERDWRATCEEIAADGRGEHKQKQGNQVKGVGSSTHSFRPR